MSSAERADPPDREPLDDWIQQAFPGPVSDTPAAPSESASDPVELLARLAHNSARGARYELGEKLGSGGMGEVIEALDADLHRPLALKRIRRDRLPVRGSPDEHARVVMLHRFLAEAQITAQLDHPGVVPVHELGADEQGEPFFTMSRVEGEDLAHVFARVRRGEPEWTLARALGVLQRVCETVAYAHSKGVVHRDLKPANVMVGPFGQVYVMDWGLARVLPTAVEELRSSIATDRQREVESDPDSPLATLPGRQMGTPAYMAPEQARGEPADGSSDVYALGAILYELLTGAHPYASSAPSSRAAVLEAVRAGPPPLLDRRAPNTPAEVAAICERAIARAPADRYANPSAMANDLRAFLEQRVVSAYETGAWAEARKWIGRNRALAASLAAALVVLVGGSVAVAVFARIAEQRATRLLQLADLERIDRLYERADALWPIVPSDAQKYDDWVREARALVGRRVLHQGTLASLNLETATTADGAVELDWERTTLKRLLAALDRLADPATGLIDGIDPQHAWGLQHRLERARSLAHDSIDGPEARELWKRAAESIRADARFGGLELRPQLGLVPLGPDPASGLWEFAHVLSGETPPRDASERLAFRAASALVLVLLPGGTFTMGAQPEDELLPNFDPYAQPDEGPPHEVTLGPFFFSKYEMTQAQWLRLAGSNPSAHVAPDPSSGAFDPLTRPVESVSWNQCELLVHRLGLTLPAEDQWEYACRGGTSGPWWIDDPYAHPASMNLVDSAVMRAGLGWPMLDEDLDDGYVYTAPVDALDANPFGLHHVLGNVWEWCAMETEDDHGSRAAPAVAPDRGGSHSSGLVLARAGKRDFRPPDTLHPGLGLRPARSLER